MGKGALDGAFVEQLIGQKTLSHKALVSVEKDRHVNDPPATAASREAEWATSVRVGGMLREG